MPPAVRQIEKVVANLAEYIVPLAIAVHHTDAHTVSWIVWVLPLKVTMAQLPC